MAINKVDGSWVNFPYGKNFINGASNNGGFNLVEDPSKIELITEFEKLPKIKESVLKINAEKTPFMTTGFLFDRSNEDSVYTGYIEFCFRPEVNFESLDITLLDEMFIDHHLQANRQEWAEFFENRLIWEIREGTVQLSSPVPVYCVFFQALDHGEADRFLVVLLSWLHSSFTHLIPNS